MKKIKQIVAVIIALIMTQGVIAQAENPIEEILRTQPKEKIHISQDFTAEELENRIQGHIYIEISLAIKDYNENDGHYLNGSGYIALNSNEYCYGDVVEIISVYNPYNHYIDDCVVWRSKRIHNIFGIEKIKKEEIGDFI